MMTVQTEIVNLTTATTSLLNEVITKKAVLDAAEGKATDALNATNINVAAAKASEVASKTSENNAKTQADRAKTEADRASQISGLSTVAEAIGMAALPLPDVWAPLSDSLRMITGYGRDVLVGADVVARMVNFSRSTTATYIGKDGQLKTAAVNEPRFEKEGLLIEGQSTNLFLNSENVAVWANPPVGSASTRELQAVQGGLVTCKVTATSVNGGVRQTYTSPAGGVHTVSFYLSKNSQSLKFLLENGGAAWGMGAQAVIAPATGTITEIISITSAKSIPFLDGYIYQLTLPAGKAGGILNAEWRLNAAGDMYIGMPQLEALPFASSYIPTAGAAVTRAGDTLRIPTAGNLPTDALTFCVDVADYNLDGSVYGAVVIAPEISGVSRRFYLGFTGAGVTFIIGNKTAGTAAAPIPGSPIGCAISTKTGRFKLFYNGAIQSSGTFEGPAILRSELYIGSYNPVSPGGSLNGHMRNLRIWHKFLTDEQIKALK